MSNTAHQSNLWPSQRPVDQFRQIYDANYNDVSLYCLRRAATVSEAEDFVADTFTTAWQKFDQIPEGKAARFWLYGVARNHLRNGWRKTSRTGRLTERLISEASTTLGPADPAVEATETVAELVRALHKLKPAEQEVMKLACWEELSIPEIAIVLDCSENAASIRLHRAKKRFDHVWSQMLKDANRPRRLLNDRVLNSNGEINV